MDTYEPRFAFEDGKRIEADREAPPETNLRAMPGVKLEVDPQILEATRGLAAAAEIGELRGIALVFLRADGNMGSLRYCPQEPFKMLGGIHVLAAGLARDIDRESMDETPPRKAP